MSPEDDDVQVYEITIHRSELIPGGIGARIGWTDDPDDYPGRQFLIIPDAMICELCNQPIEAGDLYIEARRWPANPERVSLDDISPHPIHVGACPSRWGNQP